MQKEIAGAAQSSGRMRRAARLRPPMDKEDERANLRRDTDDVIRFAGILEIAGAQLKPASFWAVSLTDRVYVAAGGRPR